MLRKVWVKVHRPFNTTDSMDISISRNYIEIRLWDCLVARMGNQWGLPNEHDRDSFQLLQKTEMVQELGYHTDL